MSCSDMKIQYPGDYSNAISQRVCSQQRAKVDEFPISYAGQNSSYTGQQDSNKLAIVLIVIGIVFCIFIAICVPVVTKVLRRKYVN